MNDTKQQYKNSPSVVYAIHTGALASCQAATAPLSQYAAEYTMCLRIHQSSLLFRQVASQMHGAFQGVHESRELGCDIRAGGLLCGARSGSLQ